MFNGPAKPEERAWKEERADVGQRQTILRFSIIGVPLAELPIYTVDIRDNENSSDGESCGRSEVAERHIGSVEVVSWLLPNLGVIGVQ